MKSEIRGPSSSVTAFLLAGFLVLTGPIIAAPGDLLLAIHNPSPNPGDLFGWSIAARGNDIIVGAYFDDADAEDCGIVYLFDGATGALLQTFHHPVPSAGAWFGYG